MENKTIHAVDDQTMETVAGGFGEGGVIASGSFASNSGTSLNLLVNWSVDGQRTLNVSVAATSYSLVSQALVNGVQLTINGILYSSSSNAIDYHGNGMATHPLASFSIPNFYGLATATAVFHFNGVISGQPVSDIMATGTINA